jgi:hypothetical protein
LAQSDLERARAFYNEGHFDESIAAATAALMKPAAAPSATLIAARARLERFRLTKDPQDLTAARSDLVSLNPLKLGPQEAIEWQIGLGAALFLDDQPGPASEMFMNVISTARGRMPAQEFEKLLEWWAATLSRVAEALSGPARKDAYSAMQTAVRDELDRDPLSRPATYWSVVARRGRAIWTVPGTPRWPAGSAPALSRTPGIFAPTSIDSSRRRSFRSAHRCERVSGWTPKRPRPRLPR